ncbi:hypothetical protein BG004_005056, partial [Podila humilis]
MPKSSSKRKKEKNADFKKTKLKVGKKKVVADSFTDTSFKSKAISLPSQSISHDKTTLLTNSRNVTFAELMTQLKHYSPGTRKDALLGLRDLFHRHPHLLPLHLGVLINAVVRLLIDDSSVVRKALETFLSEFVPMLHPRDIHPFLPLLIVYTCSAMTHILEDIREDALKFMDIWVACGGQVVVNGFWDKILPNYISLLTSDSNATNASKMASAMSFSASASSGMVGSGSSSLSSSSTASSSSAGKGAGKVITGASTGKNAPGSLKAKAEVLQSLDGFLREGLGSTQKEGQTGGGGGGDPYWFLRNFLGTAHARKSFNTSRTQLDVHEPKKKSGSRKRKASSSNSNHDASSGRSKRRSKSQEAGSSDEDSESSSSEEESEESEDESEQSHAVAENDFFNPSPVVSFARAHNHQHLLATLPVHPSITQSFTAQTIFGQGQGGSQGTSGSSIITTGVSLRIFPQQGGASASGAGANVGVSGSGKTGGNNNNSTLGGVQGRLEQIRSLIATLHPLLLSVWLDTAPTVFNATTAIHANHGLTIVHLVMNIWGTLWRAALAKPKKKSVGESGAGDEGEEKKEEEADEKWLDEYLQSMLRHVLIYFPFGKDTVGMTDVKVASLLQDMNTTYCELTSLFMLGTGIGQIRRVHKDTIAKAATHQKKAAAAVKTIANTKTSNRPSNKSVKKKVEVQTKVDSESSDDYDSEEDINATEQQRQYQGNDNMISFHIETPKWADQVVLFVLTSLGWSNPDQGSEDEDEEDEESVMRGSRGATSSDFKSQHLVALLPTLWTLLNCLEVERKEWVFEALMSYFDNAHVQSSTKRIVLQFLSLIIKLQSHPHYTGSFSIKVPGSRNMGATTTRRILSGLSKKERKEQQASISKLSVLLSTSLLKLPKLLWDLGTEQIETSQTILDLLAWVTVIAGESKNGHGTVEASASAAVVVGSHVEEKEERDRVQFLKTLQSYMSLFFCVTMAATGSNSEKRTVMGPFVRLPPALQRRAIEIVYYAGVVSTDISYDPRGSSKAQRKLDAEAQKKIPLLAAVKACCQASDLSDETRLYIEETLRIR